MFENEIEICKAFNMTPFEVRRERFSEFLLLIKRMNTYKPRAEEQQNHQTRNDGKKRVTVKVVNSKQEVKKRG